MILFSRLHLRIMAAILGALIILAWAGSIAVAMAADRPNILFIMADDHSWQAVGCYKSHLSGLNPTPTIDRLAAEGMVFDNAVVTNSICTPSRACIMTGQYSHVNGVLTLRGRLPAERQYLTIELRKAGYQTAIVGKWHLKELPTTFDYYKVLPGQGRYFDPEFFESGHEEKVMMKGHSTDCITEAALEWFKKKRDPKKPFFFMLHYKAPHDFFEYAPRYENYLADVQIPEPPTLWQRGEGSIATRGYKGELERVIATSIGRRNFRRNYVKIFHVDPTLSDEEAKRVAYNIYLKRYLRCVKGIDDNLRKVFDYLRQAGLMDNTLIIYTSDQGMVLGEHDMQDKRWAYEPCLRIPLIVRYPKSVLSGARSDALIENIDIPVTILDYAGVARPSYMQGRSFRPILETGKEPPDWRQETYYQYWMHMAHHDVPAHIAMRTKRYKLIMFYGVAGNGKGFGNERSKYQTPPGWELYDLQKDPNETDNLYDDPAYADVVTQLKERFGSLRHRIGADQPGPDIGEATKETISACNAVIEEFWDYSEEDQQKAIRISHEYYERFGKAQ